jgi:hypothetical protein
VLLLLGLALWYWLWSLNNARGQLHVLWARIIDLCSSYVSE